MRIENSFILAPGIGKKTEQKLWKNDIIHWDHFPDNSVTSKNKAEKVANFLDKAKRNLEVGNTEFFQDKLPSKSIWRIYRNFEQEACFFDIETTGLDKKRNKITTVSFYRNGESKTLVHGQDLTRENIRKEVFKSKILVSFNGKRFDQPFIEQKYNLDIQTPHIDLMYLCKRIGHSGGLKNIEKQLGINRGLEDVDGREAIRLWKKYEKNGDQDALNKLVKYNQYDAENLETLMNTVYRRLEQEICPEKLHSR